MSGDDMLMCMSAAGGLLRWCSLAASVASFAVGLYVLLHLRHLRPAP